jgi:hypothetical protein
MMPTQWHASSARRRHPQAILLAGLTTRRPTSYFGRVRGFRCGPRRTGFDRRRPFAQAERQRSGKALSWRLETHKLKIKASAETSVVDSRTPTGRVAVNNSPSAADTADRMALGHGSPRSETSSTRLGLAQAWQRFVGSFWRAVRENGEADDWPFPQGRSDPGFSLGRLFGSDQKRDIGPRCKLRYSDL